MSDQQLIRNHELLAPYTIVRLSRLSLAIRVVTKCEGDLHRLLFAARGSPKSWLKAVEDDFKWLQVVSDEFKRFVSPDQLFRAFREAPKQMKRSIKKACCSEPANVLLANETSRALTSLGNEWVCEACNLGFATLPALRTHDFDVHGYIRTARSFVNADAVCGH